MLQREQQEYEWMNRWKKYFKRILEEYGVIMWNGLSWFEMEPN
jgi:hypothetical protein